MQKDNIFVILARASADYVPPKNEAIPKVKKRGLIRFPNKGGYKTRASHWRNLEQDAHMRAYDKHQKELAWERRIDGLEAYNQMQQKKVIEQTLVNYRMRLKDLVNSPVKAIGE